MLSRNRRSGAPPLYAVAGRRPEWRKRRDSMGRGGCRVATFTRAGAFLIAVLSCCSLLSCARNTPVVAEAPPPPPPPIVWPTNGWQTSTPESQGIDSRVLADAIGEI